MYVQLEKGRETPKILVLRFLHWHMEPHQVTPCFGASTRTCRHPALPLLVHTPSITPLRGAAPLCLQLWGSQNRSDPTGDGDRVPPAPSKAGGLPSQTQPKGSTGPSMGWTRLNPQHERAPHSLLVSSVTMGMGGKVGSTLAIDFPSGPVS